ncbi:MAG TPA: amidohydrolase family protein, partial [Gemmatimonadales bacterium]|nr:amidohydrolase family protein [Gemmatimonadales bacterium]
MRATILAAALAAAAGLAAPRAASAQLAVRGDTVYTMAGGPLRDGVVLVGRDGRIERVGPAADVPVPAGYRLLTARYVTPGLVDAHTVVGLSGMLNQPHDQDQLERSDPIQPELRAVDAYNAREDLVAWVRAFGVTTMHTGHGPGALVSGQTMVVRSTGATVTDALVDSVTMVAMTLGPDVGRNYNSRPGTRARGIATLRAEFVKAREYAAKRARAGKGGEKGKGETPPRDLGLEVMARVLAGELPALITAQTAREILAALRLRREFGFRLVLDGAAEAHLVLDEIKAAGVPVILHPTMARHSGTMENATFESARKLRDAGIPFALQSGYEGYVPKTRVVLFEAAMAAAYGLTVEQALATVTIDAARIIGQDTRVGSLERGKEADLALFDGPPLEHTSHVCAVVVRGVVAS